MKQQEITQRVMFTVCTYGDVGYHCVSGMIVLRSFQYAHNYAVGNHCVSNMNVLWLFSECTFSVRYHCISDMIVFFQYVPMS